MSPIGRVFIILNLVLAAAFVGFASTFLQNHTRFKVLYEQEKAAHAATTDRAQTTEAGLRTELTLSEQRVTQTQNQLEATKTQLQSEQADNARRSRQQDTMEGNINLIMANTGATADAIKAQGENSQTAYQANLQAQQDKDQAVQAREEAIADLRDANFQSSQLRDQIEALTAQVAELQKDNRQRGILLDAARANGFIAAAVQPDLRGVVSVVGEDQRLLTVSITENPGEAEIEPGISFAIVSGSTFKAEARVTSVEGTFAFCRVDARAQGAPPIAVGDRALTVLN